MSDSVPFGDAVETTNKMTFQWRIPSFTSLFINVNDQYESPVFTFADSNWSLRLFPYGLDKVQYFPGWMSVYLRRINCLGLPRKRVYFTLGIKTFDGKLEKRENTELEHSTKNKAERIGIRFFWLRSELLDKQDTLLPNNVLTIVCNLSTSRRDDYGVRAGGEKVARSVLSMQKRRENCDIAIKIKDRIIPAHRVILRARSPVFHDMLQSELLKRQKNVVIIENFNYETILQLLDYIYVGSCLMSAENVYSLYGAADRYKLDELKVECVKYMKKKIMVDSFCDIITLAVKHDDKELLECAKYFFCNKSEDIYKTDKWQTLVKENQEVVNEFLPKQ